MNKDNVRQLIVKYKNGELSNDEITEFENKIDDFFALLELAEEKVVSENEKLSQLDEVQFENLNKKIKKNLNYKFISTAISTALVFIIAGIIIFFGTSYVMDNIYNPDKGGVIVYGSETVDDSLKIWRAVATIKDLTSPFGNIGNGFSQAKGFSNWDFNLWFNDNLGRTVLHDTSQLQIQYSLGMPKKLNIPSNIFSPLYQSSLYMSAPTNKYYIQHCERHGFDDLQKIPQGTLARVIVCFNKRMSVEEYNQFSKGFNVRYKFIDTGFPEPQDKKNHSSFTEEDIKGLMIMGRPTDNYFWYNDPDVIEKLSKLHSDSAEFEQLHFISLVKYMQKYNDIVKLIYPKYTFNYEKIINYIDKNGIFFIGAEIEGDSKELLKLKDNPYVHCVNVENVVVW